MADTYNTLGSLSFDLIDICNELHRRPGASNLAYRDESEINSLTWHYNGPEVNVAPTQEAEIAHLKWISYYHTYQVIWGIYRGQPIYGHGIMYHLAVGASGNIYLMRPLHHSLWHAAHRQANLYSLSCHMILGGNQRPTALQLESFRAINNAFTEQRNGNVDLVFGHSDWSSTQCPGPHIRNEINLWKEQQREQTYRIVVPDSNCRTGPHRAFPIAMNGKAIYQPGHTFIGKPVRGETIGKNDVWVHRSQDGIGFIHSSLCEQVS